MSVSRIPDDSAALGGIVNGYAPLDSGLFVPAAYLPYGTSMPAQPAFGNNRRFWRTDLGLECYYDGTRWLTTTLFREPMAGVQQFLPITAGAGSLGEVSMWHTDYDLWVVACYLHNYVVSPNDGTKYWTLAVNKVDSAAASTSLGSYTTASDAATTYVTHKVAIGASVVQGTYKSINVIATKTSTPGGIYAWADLAYRLIVT